jgi:hypothetical protein
MDPMTSDGETTIVPSPLDAAAAWSPALGDELSRLATAKLQSTDAREELIASAAAILRRCVPPNSASGRLTGLIVGRVQSGKTLSFTAVAAAANDNLYRVILVIAGTKKILADQTKARLIHDLEVETSPSRPWRSYHNPNSSHLSSIRNVLGVWDSHAAPRAMKKTVLITVHKNPARLRALTQLLQGLEPSSLGTVLIIDDEADQAGLNTAVRDGRQSPTYRAILDLREALPSQTYLQYTATPQGNLLISLLDLLSPDFAHVLQPGAGYVGGDLLFTDGSTALRQIPTSDIPNPDDPDATPPGSLFRSMLLYFVGLADWMAKDLPAPVNRSMMVHPSQLRNAHAIYERWVRSRIHEWIRILSDHANPDRPDVIAECQAAYDDLGGTITTIAGFDQIVQRLPLAMQMTEVRVVNSDSSIDIPWQQNHAWLLIGGANLDRGFTVEGLTVTFMPRGPGVGNADTIQQRGRFFGYKAAYLGSCRVFLEPDVAEAFIKYVRHEHSIHQWLTKTVGQGVPLPELPRRFLIDPMLKPTRAAILTDDVVRIADRAEWFRQYSVMESLDECFQNGREFERFVRDSGIQFVDDPPPSPPDRRSPHQKHKIASGLSAQALYDSLLTRLKIPGAEDNERWLAQLFLIENWLESHPNATAAAVRMRPGPGVQTGRAVIDQRLDNPFQGAHPDKRGEIYPGDQAIHTDDVTLQLHVIDLYDGLVADGKLIRASVPVVTLWLREELRDDQITLG